MKGDRYSTEFTSARESREALAAAAAEEAARRNEEARGKYLAGLEAARAEKRREADAQLESVLAPERERLERAWLAAHPGRGERDFLDNAWPHLRRNLVAQLESAEQEQLKQSLRGRYAF